MASALLWLPGELRNRIYAYALAQENGVIYHDDEEQIAWLCLHPSDETPEDKSNDIEPPGYVEVRDVRKRRKLTTDPHRTSHHRKLHPIRPCAFGGMQLQISSNSSITSCEAKPLDSYFDTTTSGQSSRWAMFENSSTA